MTNRKLRVAFIHPFLFRYARGIERFTFSLANELARRDVDVDLVTWTWRRELKIDELDERVNVFRLPTSRYFASQAIVPVYVTHLIMHRYDFVWINFAGYGEAEALTLAGQRKFGIVLHFPLEEVPHRYREFQRYGLAQRAKQVVSVSEYVAAGAKKCFGRDSVVIPNCVDTEQFKLVPESRWKIRDELGIGDSPLIVTAAALEERKGIQHVLRALPKVLSVYPQVKYFVLGEGPFRSALENEIRHLGLENNVTLAGVKEDIFPFYNAADLFILLSHGEAFPLAPLEAMSVQLPLVVANQSPFNEFILPEYGILVDEKSEEAVSAAINQLLGDGERRRIMGRAGRKRVEAGFGWSQASEKYLNLMR